jgi:hypothetical protein
MNLGPIETDDQYADAAEFIETVRETVLVDWRGQHARAESLSKRARSTTPTSLRFRFNELRTVEKSLSQIRDTSPDLLRSLSAILMGRVV